jgi:hypothetical protein
MKFVFLSVLFLSLSACNFNQNIAIRGVDLHTHTLNGDTYVDLETILSLGNLQLADSNVAIKSSEQREIGETSIEQLDDGTSRVAVSINFDEANKLDSKLGKTLPNGREIPTLLGNENSLIDIPIFEHSHVYVGGKTNGNLYAGIALNIPAFDHILNKLNSPLNLFIPFPFSEEVLGVAGICSSPQSGQNGLAIFAKKSHALKSGNETSPALEEISKVDNITLFRLNYLFNKHATLRIK